MRFNPFAFARKFSVSAAAVGRHRAPRLERQRLRIESLEQRALLSINAGSPGSASGFSPLDTNQDGYVSAIDALLIINELNRSGGGAVASLASSGSGTAVAGLGAAAAAVPAYSPLDVDGDGYIAAIDALLVINQINADADDLLSIRLEVTDMADNPITQIPANGNFKLKGYVQDLRSTGNDGVFAAFADVTYESTLATVSGAIDHGIYTTGPSGTSTPGLLDEIGGISGQLTPTGPSERLLFSVPFTAGANPGTINFVADPADLISPGPPTHNSLLFNDPDHTIGGIPTSMIFYGTASLEITAGPNLSIADPAPIIEGNLGNTPLVFTVTLSEALDSEVTVNYTTEGITAVGGVDYEGAAGQLTFAPGEVTKTIPINIIGDTLNEASETFRVVLSGASGATLGSPSSAIGTILDDDAPSTVSIADPAATTEGDGNTTLNFVVTLSAPSGQTVSVDYTTVAGTALAGSDFIATTNTLTFNPGETSKQIPITIVGDTIDETTETFQVVLSSPIGVNLGTATATGTILDNDPLPLMTVNSPTVTEPTAGTSNLNFTISLSKPSGQPITVSYQTADGTAVAGSDYVALPPTQVTFAPGETSKQVVVAVNSDALAENDETLFLQVASVGTPALPSVSGTGTILDVVTGKQIRVRLVTTDLDGNPIDQIAATDPFLVTAFVEDLREGEDLDGVFQAYLDIVYNSAIVSATGPFVYGAEFPNATAGSVATAGLIDEAGAAGGEIFPANPAGQKKLFSVQVVGIAGGTATFTPDPADSSPLHDILMYGGTGPVPSGEVLYVGTSISITPPPAISIGPGSLVEGDNGQTLMEFEVTLSTVGTKTVSVQYATAPQTATPSVDYLPASGSVSFAPGETSKKFTVAVLGDTLDEDDETFAVNLSSPDGGTIGNGSAVGTIIDDDAAPLITVNNAAAVEGATNAEFTITLSAASGRTVTVNYNSVGGTATAAADFQSVAGQLTFAPGETTKTVVVPVLFDSIDEPTENFTLVLSNAVNGTVSGGPGVGSISDLPRSSLAGWVYLDANHNGIRDGGDFALSGIEIRLTGVDLFGGSVNVTQKSADNGSYKFAKLLPGTYTITQTHPIALADGPDSLGTLGGTLLNDQFLAIVVTVGANGIEYNFSEAGINPAYLNDGNFYASSLNGRI